VTLLVGIRCTDGVVVAADSALTFAAGRVHTISQQARKIEVARGEIIIACTGEVGLGQRFASVVTTLHEQNKLKGSELDCTRLMCATAVADFAQTQAPKDALGALVAFMRNNTAHLCEFATTGFQPEMKTDKCWYVSMGSGQILADAYLALMRSVFWKTGPPKLETGIFAAAWVMKHAIQAAPGLVREPIDIAVLSAQDRKARILDPDELQEHVDLVAASVEHYSGFEKMLTASEGAPELPKAPKV
jgi:20S proteasome alpha/beta subunit